MSKEKKAITEYIQKKHNDKIIVELSSIENHRFVFELFERDKQGNILIPDDMKGVFEMKDIYRQKGTFVRTNLYFLIISDVDKIINFLKNALRKIKKLNKTYKYTDKQLREVYTTKSSYGQRI
jgi:hypothetical protein